MRLLKQKIGLQITFLPYNKGKTTMVNQNIVLAGDWPNDYRLYI